MKKINKIMLIIFFLLMNIAIVNASEKSFELDWRDSDSFYTTRYNSYNNSYVADDMILNFKYREGYISIYYAYEDDDNTAGTHIRYYDNEGQTIKEKTINRLYVYDAVTNDENIYLFAYDDNSYDDILVKLDESFSIEEEYDLDDEYSYFISDANYIAPEYGMSTLSIVNDRLYVLGEEFRILSFDLNLNSVKKINFDKNTVKKYFPGIYYLMELTYEANTHYDGYDDYEFISADVNDKNVAYSKTTCTMSWLYEFYTEDEQSLMTNQNEAMPYVTTCRPIAYLGLLDSDGKKEWEKENKNYYAFINVKQTNNYIVALGITDNSSDVVIYNLDGKLVQTIKSKDNGYYFLSATPKGFIVTDTRVTDEYGYYPTYRSLKQNKANEIMQINDDDDPDYYKVASTTEHYAFPYDITVKVEGEGEVKANEKSFAGDKETFEIIPKEGHKVESVTVTDTEGNIIDVEDNTFIMPASDVTIDVKIVEEVIEEAPVIENPNTNAFPIVGLVILAVGLGYLVYKNYKKFKFLK